MSLPDHWTQKGKSKNPEVYQDPKQAIFFIVKY